MYFAIVAIDRAGAADVRARTRPADREYLNASHPGVILRLGGLRPTVSSLIVIEAQDLAAAERVLGGRPYRKAIYSRRSRSGPGIGPRAIRKEWGRRCCSFAPLP
jgi:uncharacterized protein